MENSTVLLYTILALVVGIVLLGLVVIVLRKVRRMQLRRTFGTFEGCIAVHRTADSETRPAWVEAIFRYQRDQVEILKLRSISPIPMHKFRRSNLDIQRLGTVSEKIREELPEDFVVVKAEESSDEYLFAMTFEDYAGLSAWWEARQIMGFGRW